MPTITFNSSTGSDSTASGSGGAVVANGTNASVSGSTVTLDGSPDLSGFDADADVLWLDTASGRQFFDLSGADNTGKTVTTVDAPGDDTGLTWAIGGKRATLADADSKTLFSATGAKPGWEIVLETDQTDVGLITFACAGSSSSGGRIVIRSDSSTKRKIQASTSGNQNFVCLLTGNYLEFRDINFDVIGTGRILNGVVERSTASSPVFVRCDFTTSTSGGSDSFYYSGTNTALPDAVFFECTFTGSSSLAVDCIATGVARSHGMSLICCEITNCGGGVYFGRGTSEIVNCTIAGCTGDAITAGIRTIIVGNVIDNCTGDGISLTASAETSVIVGNVISRIGAYGIQSATPFIGFVDRNAFYSTTSGQVDGLSNGPNDITMSASPFVDDDGFDFSINDDAGGGDSLRGATIGINSDTDFYPFRGWVSDSFGGGGGGDPFPSAGLQSIESGVCA